MIPQVNSFTKFDLTEEELNSAVDFSSLSRAFLQNLLAETAEEKIRLQYDPLNPSLVVQQEAYLRGKFDIISYILGLKPNHFTDITE